MKKLVNVSFSYLIAGLVAGVFFREFTKFNDFTGQTTLGVIHSHLLVLGMIFFLIVSLLEYNFQLSNQRLYRFFFPIYNAGLILSAMMFLVRGITQVLNMSLSSALTASISGMSGIGHMLLGAGLILFFVTLKKQLNVKAV